MEKFSYPCQKAIIERLPFFQRKMLARMAPEVRSIDNRSAYSFKVVHLAGWHPEYLARFPRGAKFHIDIDDETFVVIKKSERDDSTVICYERRTPEPGKKFKTKVITVPGLSLQEAFNKWIDCNINRAGTAIDHLCQEDGYEIPNSRIECINVFTILMFNHFYEDTSPYLPETIKVNNVILDHECLLPNSTIRNVPTLILDSTVDYTVDDLLNLNCEQILIQSISNTFVKVIEYCKRLQEIGKPDGFECTFSFYNKKIELNLLRPALSGKNARLGLRQAFTMDIVGMPEAEMILTVNPKKDHRLVIKVEARGTAVPTPNRRQSI